MENNTESQLREERDRLAKQNASPYHETAPARELAFRLGWDACYKYFMNHQESTQPIFDAYHDIKEKIGQLGYNNFIHSKEVEEYREWLRNDKYKHRLEWFEKTYPNGLYYKDEDDQEIGVRLMTKGFLAEADAAWEQQSLSELSAKDKQIEELKSWNTEQASIIESFMIEIEKLKADKKQVASDAWDASYKALNNTATKAFHGLGDPLQIFNELKAEYLASLSPQTPEP